MSATFYIETRIENAVEKQKIILIEKNMDIYKTENKTNNTLLNVVIDSIRIQNNREHILLLDRIDGINTDIKILTYVVTKENKKLRNDLKDFRKDYIFNSFYKNSGNHKNTITTNKKNMN